MLGLNLTSSRLQSGSKKEYGKKKIVKHLNLLAQLEGNIPANPTSYTDSQRDSSQSKALGSRHFQCFLVKSAWKIMATEGTNLGQGS